MAGTDPFATSLMFRYVQGIIPEHIRRSSETVGEANKRKRGPDTGTSLPRSKASHLGGDDHDETHDDDIQYVRLQFLAPRMRNLITNQICEAYTEKTDVILFVMPFVLPGIVSTHAFSGHAMAVLITINRHTSPFTTMITTSEIHPNNRYTVRRFDRFSASASLGSLATITSTPLRQFLQHVHAAGSLFAKTRQSRVLVFASPASGTRPCDILLHTIAAVYELSKSAKAPPGMVNIAIDQNATALVAFATRSANEKEAPVASVQLAEAIYDRVLPRLTDSDTVTPDGILALNTRRQVTEIGAMLSSILTATEPIWFCFMSQPIPKYPLEGLAIVTLADYADSGTAY